MAVGFYIGTKGYMGTGVSIQTGTSIDFWEYTSSCPSQDPPTNTTPAGNLSICSGNSTTLTASGTGTLGWYNSPEGGTWLGGGSSFTTPILTANTTYYVQDSTCAASATRTSIAITVIPTVGTTTAIIITANRSCLSIDKWDYHNYLCNNGNK